MVKAIRYVPFLLLFFIMLSGAQAANVNDSVMNAFNFDNDNISGTNLYDLTGQNNNGTLNGGVSTGEVGVINQSVDVQLTERILMPDMPQLAPGYQKPFSFSVWINVSDVTQNIGVFHFADATVGNHHTNMFVTTNSANCAQGAGNGRIVYINSKAGTYDNYTCSDTLLTNNNWYHVVVTYDNVTRETAIYINGSLDYSQYDGFDSNPAASLSTSRLAERTNALQGRMDEWAVFNFTLSPDQVTTLYNSGAGLAFPYTGLFESVSDDIKGRSAVIRNPDSITVNSATYQTVTEGLYNHDHNTTIYLSAGFDFIPNTPITSTCQIVVNGTVYGEATRTSTAAQNGEAGNVYFVTPNISINAGLYEFGLQCLKSGGGFYQVNNSYIFVNDLLDHDTDNLVNYQYFNDNYSSLGTGLNFLEDIAFSLNQSLNGSGSAEKHLIIDGYVEFEYNSDGFINFTVQTPDTFGYTHYNLGRYGTAGSTGNGAYFTVNITATPNATGHIGVRLYAGSTTGDGAINVSLMLIELNVPRAEIGRQDLILTSFPLDTADFKYITDVVVKNNESFNQNLLYNVFASTRSNSGTATSYLQVRLNDSTNGSIRPRYYTAAMQDGVTSFKDIFEVAAGDWNVSLWGYCDNSDCTIQSGQLITYFTEVDAADVSGFWVTLNDTRGFDKEGFNVTLSNGNVFSTTNGNVTVFSDLAEDNLTIGGFDMFNLFVQDHNVSLNLQATGVNYYTVHAFNYTGWITNLTNFTRNLTLNGNISCFDGGTNAIETYTDGNFKQSDTLNCRNGSATYAFNYTHDAENAVEVSYLLNTTYNATYNYWFANQTFSFDLNNPAITLYYNISEGFNNELITVNMRCTDSAFTPLLYNVTFNGAVLHQYNETNNTLYSNSSNTVNNTVNNLFGKCSDLFGSVNTSDSLDVFLKEILLIDERENSVFDVTNLSQVRLYFDDNRTFYDLKGNNTARVNVTMANYTKLRLELVYLGNVIITRYIDITLFNGTDPIRLCANKEGITYNEMPLISAIQRPVLFKNVFSDCYIAGDYTRFAFENTFKLPAFTIDAVYSLFTFSNNQPVFLASIEGASGTFINLDSLEFNLQQIDVSTIDDSLTVQKFANQTALIRYTNFAYDNDAARVEIERLDTNALIFNETMVDANNFTIIFDWSTLSNLTNSTVFLLTMYKTKDSEITTIKYYFDQVANTGRIDSRLAFVIAILLTMFGLTFTVTRLALSWFGAIMIVASLAVLSAGVIAWYSLIIMAVNVILLMYIGLIMWIKNKPTVG